MSKIAVVTDSTAYIPNDLLTKYNITVVPLVVVWGNESLRDGIDILPDQFYRRLAKSNILPTTSQPSTAAMQVAFESLLKKGQDIVGIFISSKLSGTVQSALHAREALHNATNKIVIVDSLSTSMGMAWQVLTVARAAMEGANLHESQKLAEEAKKNSGNLFVVETLEFLHRGGRISSTQAMLGTMMKIKPVLEIVDGRIEIAEKVRTKGKAHKRLIDLVIERVAGRTPVRLAAFHANARADALSVFETAKAKLEPIEGLFGLISPVIGTHTGPGTVGLAYIVGM